MYKTHLVDTWGTIFITAENEMIRYRNWIHQ